MKNTNTSKKIPVNRPDIVDRRGRRRNTTLAKVLRFIKSKLRKVKEKV